MKGQTELVDSIKILKTIILKDTQGDKNVTAFCTATKGMSPAEVAAFESFIVGWFAATADEHDWQEAINTGCKVVKK